MSTPNNGPLGLTPPTPSRQNGDGWTDDGDKAKARANHKPYVCFGCGENYANPNPEPLDIPAYCPQCAPMHEAPPEPDLCPNCDGNNCEFDSDGPIYCEWCKWCRHVEYDDGGRCIHCGKEEIPVATYVSELALDQWREGVKHGISQVISYLSGRLGNDPLIGELQAHFEGEK